MLIADLLRHKGSTVVTIAPTAKVTELLVALDEHRIGGVVVTDDDAIIGIVSERDVVRRLHRQGADALMASVADLMTTTVITCTATDSLDAIATTMTENRIRHMPVVDDGRLIGIVTIGDVVAAELRSLEQERLHLENYITRG